MVKWIAACTVAWLSAAQAGSPAPPASTLDAAKLAAILGPGVELGNPLADRRPRPLAPQAPKRDDHVVQRTEAAAELAHACVVPALVPWSRYSL